MHALHIPLRAPPSPEKPTLDGIEARWAERWEADGVYRFDRTPTRDDVFAIDTPPPTVSGSVHMGTIFGYTQFDAIARYQRMRGKHVFFPLGWDDNGLATERRVQNFYGVRCDPPVRTSRRSPRRSAATCPKGTDEIPVSRPNFVELCHELTATDEAVFEDVFRRLGLSVDWSLLYTTVGEASRRVSQRRSCTTSPVARRTAATPRRCGTSTSRPPWPRRRSRTASAPAPTTRVAFHGARGRAHRDVTAGADRQLRRPRRPSRRRALPAAASAPRCARRCSTSRFPIVAHPLADPDKGTGIAMVCTFGDVTDVTWWRELDLPTRSVIGRDGRFSASHRTGSPATRLPTPTRAVAGRTVKQAQAATVEALRESGELIGEPQPITHPVKFYERGSRPLEIVTSRQWYIRNGGRDDDRRQDLLARGKELAWYPDHMRHRYNHWVEGLNGDWLISRQRFFGVPIPLWYPVGDDGEVDYDTSDRPGGGRPADRPVDRRPARLHRRAA